MVTKNELLPFATAVGAGVLAPDDYESLTARQQGFANGVAIATELNTVWRQASVVASMIGQFTTDGSGLAVYDDGDVVGLETKFKAALAALIGLISETYRPYFIAVISDHVNSPPTNPAPGDTYLIPVGATGDWDGLDNIVAQYGGTAGWVYVDYPLQSLIGIGDTGDFVKRTADGWTSLFATFEEAIAGTDGTIAITPKTLIPAVQSLLPSVTASSYPPASAPLGSTWFDTDKELVFERLTDGVNTIWLQNTL